jgi:hypothetical protein
MNQKEKPSKESLEKWHKDPKKTNAFYLPKEWLGPAGLLISPTLFQLQFL